LADVLLDSIGVGWQASIALRAANAVWGLFRIFTSTYKDFLQTA
jgi:hypothetical protein